MKTHTNFEEFLVDYNKKVEEFNQETEEISKRKKAHLKSLEVAKKTLGLLPFTIVAEATINNMQKQSIRED